MKPLDSQLILREIENTLREWKLAAWANGILHYVVGIAGLILAPLSILSNRRGY